MRIGIAWSGNKAHDNATWRDVPLAEMLRLCEVPGVEVCSLQVSPDTQRMLDEAGANGLVRDFSGRLSDMKATALILRDEIDLVIACDTSVVHLAGAMGLPAWVLINQQCVDWRWGRSGERSPWYDSVRIWRKERGEGWGALMGRVACALDRMMEVGLGGHDKILR